MDRTSPAADDVTRRSFLRTSLAAATGPLLAGQAALGQNAAPPPAPPPPPPPKIERKIKVALVGCGGRGSWIANHFKNHGGYQFVSVADYHLDRAQKTGQALGAEQAKCFGGLSACKRAVESGAEAVILQTPPYFFPEHAAAAVQAGLHVYMAKPVAVDVPGTMKIGQLGKDAAAKKQVFHVDYQMPTDPFNIEVRNRLLDGALGKLQMVFSVGTSEGNGFNDPPLGATIENRLISLIWVNDDALGCGYIGNYDIHVIDAIIWALGRRPVSAYARGGRCRKDPHGDAFDTNFVTYAFEDGLTWNHHSAAGPSHDWLKQGSLEGAIQGDQACAHLAYWGKAYVRGGPKHFAGGKIENLYDAGAIRNIAAFYNNVITGQCDNATAQRSVDCTLTCILGREASRRGTFMTMADLIKEDKALEIDLKGLKA